MDEVENFKQQRLFFFKTVIDNMTDNTPYIVEFTTGITVDRIFRVYKIRTALTFDDESVLSHNEKKDLLQRVKIEDEKFVKETFGNEYELKLLDLPKSIQVAGRTYSISGSFVLSKNEK